MKKTTDDGNDRVRMVCFDLGGVMVRICRSWEEGCARAGVPVRGDSASDEMKVRRRTITGEGTIGAISEQVWVDRIVEVLGGRYSPDEIMRIHHAWLIEEYQGWPRLIEEIRSAGYSTACLSNTVEGHWERLVHARVNGQGEREAAEQKSEFPAVPLLDYQFASHLMGVAKPNPEIYSAFEKQTGFRGKAILFFDDLAENIEAARRLGWRAERIDHGGDTAEQVRGYLKACGLMESDKSMKRDARKSAI